MPAGKSDPFPLRSLLRSNDVVILHHVAPDGWLVLPRLVRRQSQPGRHDGTRLHLRTRHLHHVATHHGFSTAQVARELSLGGTRSVIDGLERAFDDTCTHCPSRCTDGQTDNNNECRPQNSSADAVVTPHLWRPQSHARLHAAAGQHGIAGVRADAPHALLL